MDILVAFLRGIEVSTSRNGKAYVSARQT
jgi:hypothetical protein